jgi:hypothetical protein
MARRQTTPAQEESQSLPTNLARAPDGFRRLGSVTAACWFALQPGNIIRGKLLGLYERDDKRNKVTGKSEFFQVALTAPTTGRFGTGEKAEDREAEAGLVVNLNCNTKTAIYKDLITDINNGAEYEIYARCGEKLDLKNGNTMWDITTFSKQTKAPKAVTAVEPDFSGDGSEGGDESDSQDSV